MSWQEYCNQASQAVSQGNYAEAERFIYEAFKEARQEKNLERIYTALDLLGWLAFMQTKYDDAEKIYQYVAKVKVQLFGADHVEIAKTLKNLIAAAYQVKQYERVVPYAKEASRIFAANLGAAHPECQAIAVNLFELLKWLNRPGEAEEVRISYLAPPPPPIQPTAPQFGQQAGQQNTQSGGYAQAQQPQQQYQQNSTTGTGQYQQTAPQQQAPTNYGTGTGQYSNLTQQQPQPQQAQQAAYGTGTGQYSNLAQQQQQPQQAQQAAHGTGTGQYSNLQAQQAQQAQYSQQAYQQAQPTAQQQQPIAPTQGHAGSAPPQSSKSDYSKYAKSICEVCQYEYDGPECLRCTSGQLTVFDPNSRLNW